MVEPLPFLGRAVKPNTGGVGRRAGGAGFESMRTVKDVSRWLLYEMGNGYMTSDGGLFGGYPAASGYILNAKNTDLEKRFENGEDYPQHDLDPESGEFESKVDGEITRRPEGISTPKEFDDYDMYLNYLRGGSGLGDPLERDPEDVLSDIHDGYVLPGMQKMPTASSSRRSTTKPSIIPPYKGMETQDESNRGAPRKDVYRAD